MSRAIRKDEVDLWAERMEQYIDEHKITPIDRREAISTFFFDALALPTFFNNKTLSVNLQVSDEKNSTDTIINGNVSAYVGKYFSLKEIYDTPPVTIPYMTYWSREIESYGEVERLTQQATVTELNKTYFAELKLDKPPFNDGFPDVGALDKFNGEQYKLQAANGLMLSGDGENTLFIYCPSVYRLNVNDNETDVTLNERELYISIGSRHFGDVVYSAINMYTNNVSTYEPSVFTSQQPWRNKFMSIGIDVSKLTNELKIQTTVDERYEYAKNLKPFETTIQLTWN